jgi:hypothetical protein
MSGPPGPYAIPGMIRTRGVGSGVGGSSWRIMVRAAIVLAGLGILAIGSPAVGDDASGWEAVSAIFARRCVMCHAAHGAALGLRLDSYEAALAGGLRGPVLVPGDAGASELVRRLRGESVPRMPFLSYPLPPEEIEVVVRWVEAGLQRGPDDPAPPVAAP